MGSMYTTRRYYLRASCTKAEEGEEDLAVEILGLRAKVAVTPLGACPSRKKLEAAISAELEDNLQRQVKIYEGLEDLDGADEDELTEAGLTEVEAQKVIEFIEAL